MAPADAAVFGLQAGMGNIGYTFGGAICFMVWGLQGLAVEQIFTMMWPFFAFLFCFPIARHYGEVAAAAAGGAARPAISPWRLVLRTLRQSLLDLRSLPLYAATAGVVLNLANETRAMPPVAPRGLRCPACAAGVRQRWHIIPILMIVGILMQFGSIGMTIKAGRIPVFWKTALGSAALKFLLSPLVMLGAALALGLEGMQLEVCVLLAAMPTAVYSILMANLFGLNRDLANTTFILTHAIAFAAMVPAMAVWHWLQ